VRRRHQQRPGSRDRVSQRKIGEDRLPSHQGFLPDDASRVGHPPEQSGLAVCYIRQWFYIVATIYHGFH
jgi:hypothetical protein